MFFFSMELLLMQVRVAMVTADVSIAALTNQKARRARAMRNMYFARIYTPVKVR